MILLSFLFRYFRCAPLLSSFTSYLLLAVLFAHFPRPAVLFFFLWFSGSFELSSFSPRHPTPLVSISRLSALHPALASLSCCEIPLPLFLARCLFWVCVPPGIGGLMLSILASAPPLAAFSTLCKDPSAVFCPLYSWCIFLPVFPLHLSQRRDFGLISLAVLASSIRFWLPAFFPRFCGCIFACLSRLYFSFLMSPRGSCLLIFPAAGWLPRFLLRLCYLAARSGALLCFCTSCPCLFPPCRFRGFASPGLPRFRRFGVDCSLYAAPFGTPPLFSAGIPRFCFFTHLCCPPSRTLLPLSPPFAAAHCVSPRYPFLIYRSLVFTSHGSFLSFTDIAGLTYSPVAGPSCVL